MDKLVIEGINHKGFGTIPKAIMLWPSHDLVDENGTVVAKGLHNTAKAICGYILCYSGGGRTSFPGRDKICNDLGINKDTYTKYKKQLEETGVLRISKQRFLDKGNNEHTRKKQGSFSYNTYTLVLTLELHPVLIKYLLDCVYLDQEEHQTVRQQKLDKLKVEGLEFLGFGKSPKAVMQLPSNDLHVNAKALYLYFSAWAGYGNSAFPLIPKICRHLGIGKEQFYRHMNQIKKLGLITTQQSTDSQSKFTSNTYTLHQKPCTDLSDTVKSDKVKVPLNKQNKPCTGISDTVVSDTDKSDTVKPDTNINKSFNTNSLKEKEKHQQQNTIVDDDTLFEIEKEYTKITGRKDLSTRALKRRISEITDIQITVDYLQEKLVVLTQKLDQTNNPAAFLIAAIKEDWRPAPEQIQIKIEVLKCPNCHQAMSACVCEKPESPEAVELYAQARQAAEVLGINGSIFTRITATSKDGHVFLTPSTPIFKDEVQQGRNTIDAIMKHMDKPYVLDLQPDY